jgi:biotin carboxyl carrier protein
MTAWIVIGGERRRVELKTPPASLEGSIECLVDGDPFAVDARVLRPGVMSLLIEGRQYNCVLDGEELVIDGRRIAFEVDDPRSLAGRLRSVSGEAGPRPIKSPMPGRVVRVIVAAGGEVEEHQAVLVIEAMKMQNELKAPKAGRVTSIAVAVGDTVGAGDVLAIVE